MNGKYQVGSGRIVTVTHDTPFIDDTIQQASSSVKENLSDTQNQARGKDFSMRNVVEETADLVAMHNMTPSQLMEAIKRDSLVMPSIAVTNTPFTSFGEVSVVFYILIKQKSRNAYDFLFWSWWRDFLRIPSLAVRFLSTLDSSIRKPVVAKTVPRTVFAHPSNPFI